MEPLKNNQNQKEQTDNTDLSARRYAARIEMESEEEKKRREVEENIKRMRENEGALKKKIESDKKNAEEKIQKEKEDRDKKEKELSKATATKITTEVEKIKSVGAQISSLRTFKTDMNEMVQEQNISLARIAMQEETRRREQGKQSVDVKSKNKIYLILSLLFIISGGATGWYLYTNSINIPEDEMVVETVNSKPIIYTETRMEIEYSSLSKENILKEIKKEFFESEIEPGKIKNIVLFKKELDGTKKEATSSDFLSILNSGVPDDLRRALGERAGLYVISPIISDKTGGVVLKTESYQKAFAGMLKWEQGTMIRDLYEFLNNIFPEEEILALNFIDVVLNNQDARVLNNPNGQPKIVYGFLNNTTIAISGSIDGFNELVTRFRNGGTE